LIGWLHTLLSLLAIVFGAINLGARKGTARHRRIGRLYVVAMLAVCVTSLLIYRYNRFFFPHVLAIVSMACVLLAYCASHFHRPRRGWIYYHLTLITLSYYFLVSGGLNEAFVHIDVLRALRDDGSTTQGTANMVLLILFLALVGRSAFRVHRAKSGRPQRNIVPDSVR